jgi:hypothetical protein
MAAIMKQYRGFGNFGSFIIAVFTQKNAIIAVEF